MTLGPPPHYRDRQQARRTPASLLLGLLCLLVYNANLRGIGAGDTLPARFLPFAIWRHGTLELDPIARFVAHGHPSAETWSAPTGPANHPGKFFEPWAYWMIETRHHRLASLYPVVAPLLVAPLYSPLVVALEEQGWQPWQVNWVAAIMEKISASLLATVTVLVVYRLLQRDAGRWALPLAVAFAFGTNTWMTSSQALWQHGTGELLVALALLLVTSTPTPTRSAALGAVCVVMAANRPPDALLAAAIALYAVWVLRRKAWLVAGAAFPLALVVAYNLGVTGSLAGAYGTVDRPGFFEHSLGAGLAGLLLSPMRGLLVFSPFLLFVPVGLLRRLRIPGRRMLAALLTAAVIAQLLLYASADWRMGASWGPRWLTDMLPVMMWLLAPVPLLLRTWARVALVMTMAVSIAVQTIGAFWYTGLSDRILYASDDRWMPTAWQVANAPFVAVLSQPRQRGDLACSVRGYLDLIGPAPPAQAGAVAPVMVHGASLQGWALACGRTPAELLLLADGLIIGQTRQFAPARPDVAATMGTTAPSTWSVEADTRGLAPGEHVLQVAVRADERSDIRIVNETRVQVEPPLTELARRAAALLREHQSTAGYWLTTHTVEPRFANTGQEMNTFLTAMLVDLLTPVAKDHGLEDLVDKARRHLAAQIEPGGLVRYHGLPDGPGIGTLGCAITPDADDTALTWRIAPPPAGDPRRPSMLRVLKAYRDARGFYRTWLAPPERYQCLNPGRDPNPPDVTIQMHVLMMLAETDRAAAQSLCKALAGRVSDDSLWVYYARAPIVPLLRTADLQRIGCEVTIPGPRLTGVADQARWIEVARRLVESQLSSGARRDDGAATLALLGELGQADFAELRRNPPLLYHNDLTATVSRYYWSEDFGYALWLRLYESTSNQAKRSSRRDR